MAIVRGDLLEILGVISIKKLIEFINVCAWCDKYGGLVKALGEEYSDKITVKIYKAGKDFDYIKKYGMVTKSMIVINEKEKFSTLDEKIIKNIFLKVAKELC